MSGSGRPILAATVISRRELGEHRRALLVLRALAIHDVLELAVAGHCGRSILLELGAVASRSAASIAGGDGAARTAERR